MEIENKLIPDNEINVEGENSSRKNELKVTNLLSEIRITDLPKESPIQVDTSQDKDTSLKSKEEGEPKDKNEKVAEGKDKEGKEDNGEKKVGSEEKKIEEVKKSDDGDKKTVNSKNVEKEGEKSDDFKKVGKDGNKAEDPKEEDNGNKKASESKKDEKDEKKADDPNKVDDGDQKAGYSKKVEKDGKKADDPKKENNGNKKASISKKVEKEGKKVGNSKEVEKVGKKPEDGNKADEGNRRSGKSPKREKVSPLAAYFRDWDKFTIKQRIDIEKLIIKKAQELGAPSKTKSGVRTYEEKDRNIFKWNAIRRRRESRRLRESLRLGGRRSLRDRRSPIRLRGSGNSRPRDDPRWTRYSPRREVPWRSPWVSAAPPVEDLMKQMEKFIQFVDKFPEPRNMVQEEPKRLVLLPTPPIGYNTSQRGNGHQYTPIENKPRDYTDNRHAQPLSRWSATQYPINGEESSRRFFGKEPSSKSLPKQRPTPYNSQPSYSTTTGNDSWSSRDRSYSQNTALQSAVPYQESRNAYTTSYRR